MKKQDIMKNCLKQMIFDEFLSLYNDAIKTLLKDQSFLFTIKQIYTGVAEDVEFCSDNKNIELRKFKNRIGEMMFDSQAYFHCPEYRYIVDDVKRKGIPIHGKPYTAKSAAISTYYAIRFYQISKMDKE